MEMIKSRVFEIQLKKKKFKWLVPVVDMMNFNSEPNAEVHIEKKGCYINTLKDIEKGEKIQMKT